MKGTMSTSIQNFIRQCAQAASGAEGAAVVTMEEAVQELKTASLTEVPRDTGTLASSIFEEVKVNKNSVEGKVGYGAGDPVNPKNQQLTSEYMVTVHENLVVNHPTGKAKFLEDPARAQAAKLGDDYGKQVNLALKTVFGGK